jgi:hypothetical protein
VVRYAFVSLIVLLAGVSPASGQEWARKMFKVASHDFGSVARGAKAEYVFEMQNLYEEDIHVSSVRASCGCTTPSIAKETLKTWEKGGILAVFNTRSFLGQRSATITVTIDRPFYAEVQLQIEGYIRSDVVLSPGVVSFGNVELGSTAERKVALTYAGRADWKVTDVRSANTNLEVELKETERTAGRVTYEMLVRLKPETPAGYIQDELTIVTDDQRMKNIPLAVEGHVTTPLTVSPASLFLGVLDPGQTVTKQLVVQAKEPFKITGIKCPDAGFEFKPGEEAKKVHLVPVIFTAGDKPGALSKVIEIATDLRGGASAQCTATATIKAGSATTALKPRSDE